MSKQASTSALLNSPSHSHSTYNPSTSKTTHCMRSSFSQSVKSSLSSSAASSPLSKKQSANTTVSPLSDSEPSGESGPPLIRLSSFQTNLASALGFGVTSRVKPLMVWWSTHAKSLWTLVWFVKLGWMLTNQDQPNISFAICKVSINYTKINLRSPGSWGTSWRAGVSLRSVFTWESIFCFIDNSTVLRQESLTPLTFYLGVARSSQPCVGQSRPYPPYHSRGATIHYAQLLCFQRTRWTSQPSRSWYDGKINFHCQVNHVSLPR